LPVAPNLLQQDFTTEEPNRKWLADITDVWTTEGWLYLAVILDVSSRLVVGWAMASPRDEQLTERALLMALGRRQPTDELLHHSDRGSQSTSHDYQALLAQAGITVSMNN
jgi:putative transposase